MPVFLISSSSADDRDYFNPINKPSPDVWSRSAQIHDPGYILKTAFISPPDPLHLCGGAERESGGALIADCISHHLGDGVHSSVKSVSRNSGVIFNSDLTFEEQ